LEVASKYSMKSFSPHFKNAFKLCLGIKEAEDRIGALYICVTTVYYIGCTMNSVTITVRLPKELKDKLSRYEVEVSKVVRKALEEEIKRRKLESLKKAAGELGRFFAEISDEEIVESVREMRRSR